MRPTIGHLCKEPEHQNPCRTVRRSLVRGRDLHRPAGIHIAKCDLSVKGKKEKQRKTRKVNRGAFEHKHGSYARLSLLLACRCSTMNPVTDRKAGAHGMNQDQTADATKDTSRTGTPAKRQRRRILLLPVLVAVLVAVLAAVLALASGVPQRRLIPKAVQRVLGAEVSMAVRSTWNRVELGDIVVREPGEPGLPPLLRAESLSMPWTFPGPRHIPSLSITGLDIHLDGGNPQRTNYGWVRRFTAQPSSGWNLLPWTPVNITVAPIRVTASLPGASMAMEGAGAGGLALTAVTDSMQRYKIGLAGDDAELRWTLPGIAPQTFSKNGIRVQVEADEKTYAATVDLRLPKDDRVQGTIHVTPEGQDTVAEVTVKESVLRQPIWSELTASFLPVPVRFAAMECPDLRARLRRLPVGWGLEQVDLHTRITGLTVGPPAAPWFSGDVQLASVDPPKGAQFAARAVINQLPPVQFHWGAQKDGGRIGAVLDQWTREQLASLLPADMSTVLTQYVPFRTVSLSSELGPTPDGWGFSGNLKLQPAVDGGDPLTVQTRGTWKTSTLSAEAKAALGENTALEMKGLRLDPATGKASATVTGPVDLVPFAKMAGLSDLWGTAKVDARIVCNAWGNLNIEPLRATFETLGYGNLGIPYGVELAVSAPVRRGKAGLTAGPVEAALGTDTTLHVREIAWNAGRLLASGLTLESGLAPLVSKGWLAAAEGRATLRCASVTWPGPVPETAVEYDAAFARLDLPAGWCAVKGLTAKGQLNGADAGTMTADEVAAAGATLHGIHAGLRLDGANLLLEAIAFGLFGGTVTGEARLTPLDPALPVSFTAAVEKIDLEVFTKEYKPPSTRLTGLVGGRVSASLDLNGLRALDVELKSDGGITMNRDLVEQLLASEYLSGMSGGKQVSEMLRDVVGDAPQIPFTGAAMKLGLEEGRITGTARLESEKLNLTLDIKADPGALLEALRARSADAASEKSAQ